MNHIKEIKEVKNIKELIIKIRNYEPDIIILIKSFIEEVFSVGEGAIKINRDLNRLRNKNYNQFVIIDGRFFNNKRIFYSYTYNWGTSEGYSYGTNLKKISKEKKKDALALPHKYPMGMLPMLI